MDDTLINDGATAALAPIVAVHGVHRHFCMGSTEVRALQGLSLFVERGELVGICGPSGSGKSTLLNIIGLLDRADAGEVCIDGQNVAHLDDVALTRLRGHKLGFIFQSFNLIPVMSALENVMLPLLLQEVPDPVARERALAWLGRVGLADFVEARPDLLSGGQRQRVAVARALVTDPVLVIADEPTANLDTENADIIASLLHELNRSAGVTCIVATHDDRLLRHLPRRLRMQDGRWADACLHELS